jgi:putative Holliday junction resolvase
VRTLAIDYGTKRVGLALSDEGGRFATPVDVLQVTSPDDARRQIEPLARREGVQRLVVGLPLNMDGTAGGAARDVVAWAGTLAAALGVPVVFVDERLSSFDVEQRLVDRKRGGEKITRKQKKQQLDALVAASLLQQFLDGALPAVDVE